MQSNEWLSRYSRSSEIKETTFISYLSTDSDRYSLRVGNMKFRSFRVIIGLYSVRSKLPRQIQRFETSYEYNDDVFSIFFVLLCVPVVLLLYLYVRRSYSKVSGGVFVFCCCTYRSYYLLYFTLLL